MKRLTPSRIVTVFIDGRKMGRIDVPAKVTERSLVKAVLRLPAAASLLRRNGASETRYDGRRYDISTRRRRGGPLTIEEALAMPGARIVRSPFENSGIPSPHSA